MHSGSFLLALYQHRLHRCRCRFVCFLVDMRACLCVCMSARHGGRSYFFWVLDWARADCRCLHQCGYANMCVFVSWQSVDVCERESRGIISQASPRGLRGPITSKGHEGQQRQPVRQGGNPVDVAGPALARLVANTGTWRSHRLPPPMPV